MEKTTIHWFLACATADVPENSGVCVQVDNEQVALFNFALRNEWFATQNLCPHKQQMALSRGMIGSTGPECEPKVVCPFHKKSFSLRTGQCLSGDECDIKTYSVKVENEQVYIGL